MVDRSSVFSKSRETKEKVGANSPKKYVKKFFIPEGDENTRQKKIKIFKNQKKNYLHVTWIFRT